MTENISLTRKNKGYRRKEEAAQVKPKHRCSVEFLKTNTSLMKILYMLEKAITHPLLGGVFGQPNL